MTTRRRKQAAGMKLYLLYPDNIYALTESMESRGGGGGGIRYSVCYTSKIYIYGTLFLHLYFIHWSKDELIETSEKPSSIRYLKRIHRDIFPFYFIFQSITHPLPKFKK